MASLSASKTCCFSGAFTGGVRVSALACSHPWGWRGQQYAWSLLPRLRWTSALEWACLSPTICLSGLASKSATLCVYISWLKKFLQGFHLSRHHMHGHSASKCLCLGSILKMFGGTFVEGFWCGGFAGGQRNTLDSLGWLGCSRFLRNQPGKFLFCFFVF